MRLRAKMLNREEKETFPKKFGGNFFSAVSRRGKISKREEEEILNFYI